MTAKTRWWALTAVSLATLMCYLDNNVVNVALPTIERSLHLSVSGLEWIVSSYLLVLGGLLLVGGRVADVFGSSWSAWSSSRSPRSRRAWPAVLTC
jgi:MFS family permease